MNKIYDITQSKKINKETSQMYYDYTVNKVYTIKLKKYPIITVKYNNGVINFDQLPLIENGRTLVPLRAIFEKIGADKVVRPEKEMGARLAKSFLRKNITELVELDSENSIVELDEERKAAMVSNLLVVLCGNKDAQPIVNSGSIY